MSKSAAMVAVLMVAAVACGTAGSAPRDTSNVIAKIDLGGGNPCGVAGAAGSVWVTDATRDELIRINPATNAVVSRTKIDPTPCELHFAAGSLWIVTQSGRVDRVDPETGNVVARIRVGRTSYDLTYGAGSIWVTNREGRTVQRISPTRNRVVKTVRFVAAGKPGGIAWASGAAWVGDDYGNAVYRLDPKKYTWRGVKTGGITGAAWVAANGRDVWVANHDNGTVARVNTATRKRVKIVKVDTSPVNLEVIGNSVWVPCDLDNSVWRIDASTGAVVEHLGTAKNPAVIAGAEGDAWVTMFDAGSVWRIRPSG